MTPGARPEDLTNVEIVTYVLARLQDKGKSTHLERIAAKAYELAPGSFRWDLDDYATFVDKDKVRTSLIVAERPKEGGLVQAVGPKGEKNRYWRLTSAGANWVRENEGRLRESGAGPTRRFNRRKADALRNRLGASSLYDEFVKTGSVSANAYAFTDLLECSPDAADSVVARRLDELRAQVQMLEDDDLRAFLDACADAHDEMLGRS